MKTIEIKIYKFAELSEQAKQNAINNLIDINVNHNWWEFIYEDANNIGLKITSLDLDRNRHANGKFIYSAEECANKIIKEHGEQCETYKTALKYLEDRKKLVSKYSDGKKLDIVIEENYYEFDNECDELDEEFLNNILEDYSIMLQNECEYLQTDEAIIDTIEANEYDFTENGKLY
jgi:hypothetical protein